MCLSKDRTIRGVKVRNINLVLMVVTIIFCFLLLLSSNNIKKNYNQMVASMNDYSECTKAITEFRNASDFMTNQARLFAVNRDPIFVDNYFYELDFMGRRENAIEIVQLSHTDDVTDKNLQMALKESQFLERREKYSMKLVCEAVNLSDDISSQVLQIVLSDEDKLLSAEEKIIKANKILFDNEYLSSKDRIFSYTAAALTDIINCYIEVEQNGDVQISYSFKQQKLLLVILVFVSILTFIVFLIFVLHPLEMHIDAILNNRKMQETGSYELRYIAKAYNNLCDKNAVKANLLKHKAEHDPLTGLINRNAFDQIKEVLSGADEPIAYLIIDIDLFKKVNDDYGHPIGDEVLKKISSLLMETFRATDYVARIGGDEFAIIMTKFGTSAVEIIQKKIDGLNYTLQRVDDGLPSVSLSVGVAFSEEGYKPELIGQADKALYRVKKGGRCNCSFYKSEE